MHGKLFIFSFLFAFGIASNAPFRRLISDGLRNLKDLVREAENSNKNKPLTKARKILIILLEEFADLDWPLVIKDVKRHLEPKRHKAVLYNWGKLCMFSGFHSYELSEFSNDDNYGLDNLLAWRGMEAIISGGEILSEWELLAAVEYLNSLLNQLERDINKFTREVADLIIGMRLGLKKMLTYLSG